VGETEKMMKLKNILLNEDMPDDVKDAFGDVVFGEDPEILKLQSKRKQEEDTFFEWELLKLLKRWTAGGTHTVVDKLYSHFDLLKKASEYFPKILKPNTPIGTELYRGLGRYSKFHEQLKNAQSSDFEDSPIFTGFRLYKKPITYSPNNSIQSWSSSPVSAREFGVNVILNTKQDDSFLFNQELMNYLFRDAQEDEVLHFGKEYKNEVYVIISDSKYAQWILNRV
jgi:hypothetical protein